MCVSSWTVLTSISGSRRTSSKRKGRQRLSLKIWGISGMTDTTIIGLEETLLGNLGLLLLRWLARCFGNQCIKSWKWLKMSHTLNGQIRWEKTLWSATKAFIANTTRNEDTPQKIVKLWEVIWSSWSERRGWNNFYISPMDKQVRQDRDLRDMLFQEPIWARLMSSSWF